MSNVQLTDAQIAEAAFFIWLDEGQPEGRAEDHWFRATNALSPAAKPRKKAAAKPAAKKAAPKKAAAKAEKPAKPRARKAAAKAS